MPKLLGPGRDGNGSVPVKLDGLRAAIHLMFTIVVFFIVDALLRSVVSAHSWFVHPLASGKTAISLVDLAVAIGARHLLYRIYPVYRPA